LAAFCLFLIPLVGLTQIIPNTSDNKFFINGKPTRIGSDAAMYPDSPTRTKIDLSGMWNYTLDGSNWNSIEVPSAYDFTGKVIFQRKIDIKSEMLDKYNFLLVAYGINYICEISINGNFVGRHIGGYASFVFPIPQNTLQVGSENVIRVQVDNELTHRTTVPLKHQVGRWRTYGGIFRDIYILAVPKLFIEDANAVSILSTDWKIAKINISAAITDYFSGLKPVSGSLLGFQVEISDKLSGEIVGRSSISPITPQAKKTIYVSSEVTIPLPKLWSFDSPDLYVVKCQIVRSVEKEITIIDEYSFDIGIKDLQFKDGHFVLNNKEVLLKGVLWQEDHSAFGSAMTYEALEKDIVSIKTLGANLIRFLYPPHPYVINLCDRYGLFVMEEIPVDDVPYSIFTQDYFQEMISNYAKEMVHRDRKHVSILAWGIGDDFELPNSSSCGYVNSVRNIIKSLDKRLVYFGTRSQDNPCFEYVDLLAINFFETGIKQNIESLNPLMKKYPEKPLIIARYGKEVEPGNHNGYSDPFSMESQARYALQFYSELKDLKVAGSILWSYNDWRMDRPSMTTHSDDPYLRAMGIVSYEREKRTAFDIVRAMFNDEKVQALPVGNYSSNAPLIYVITGFILLILLALVYNTNRRFRDGVNRSLFRTYNFFADIRDQRIVTYFHSFFIAFVVAITLATVLSSILSHYRDNILLDNLLSLFLSDGIKTWLINLIWKPASFIVVLSGIILLKLIFLSLLVKLFSMTVKTRVLFYHSFSITMWSILPYIILIPVSMIAYRLMESQSYVLPIFVLIGIASFWVLIRFFKGISIIYDVRPIRIYFIGFFVIIIIYVAIYSYLDYTQSLTIYLKYLIQTMSS